MFGKRILRSSLCWLCWNRARKQRRLAQEKPHCRGDGRQARKVLVFRHWEGEEAEVAASHVIIRNQFIVVKGAHVIM